MESILALVSVVLFFLLFAWAIRERNKIFKWMRLTEAADFSDERLHLERELEDIKLHSSRRIADLEKELVKTQPREK